MTKIEEILEKYKTKTDHYADQEWQDSNVKKAMIEYAEWYAKKVKDDIINLIEENLDAGTPNVKYVIEQIESYNGGKNHF